MPHSCCPVRNRQMSATHSVSVGARPACGTNAKSRRAIGIGSPGTPLHDVSHAGGFCKGGGKPTKHPPPYYMPQPPQARKGRRVRDPMRCQKLICPPGGRVSSMDTKGGVRVAEQVAYNIDCMEYMRTLPDKAFDLAVVDPPYGGGSMALQGKNDSEGALTAIGPVSRTGGKWAAKYGKKLSPGTTRQAQSILMSCFAFPSSRSSGAEITSRCRPAGVF